MSAILNLVPRNRFYCPSPEDSAIARRMLAKALPEAAGEAEIDEVFSEEVCYFETGDELEDTECPHCHASLAEEIDWWSHSMRDAHDHGFADLRTRMPCCGAWVSLDQLPATGAFARYGLRVTNPPRGFPGPVLRRSLEDALGAQLRTVFTQSDETADDF